MMDDDLIYAILFVAGLAFGYPIGKIVTAKKLRPLIRKMGTKIADLEEEVVDLIASRDEVGTLERWMRN